MASIGSDPNGRKRILFVAGDGKRKTIRIGKANEKQALAFRQKVEALAASRITGTMDDETSRWLARQDATIHGKLVAVGLADPREAVTAPRLGSFIEQYIAGRSDAKGGTVTNFHQSKGKLTGYFGGDRLLSSINEGDAEEFARHLSAAGLSTASVRRHCGRAKQFFRFAVRKRLIPTNPFGEIETRVRSNKARVFNVTATMAAQLLDACPDVQWRAIIALSRFGGLRTPSETLLLRWADVDWGKGRVLVRSPKTEHHEGKDSRTIPLFPELRAVLMEAFEAAEPGSEFIITRYRDRSANLRTQFHRIIIRAGLAPWPKLFHNMRASRQTELSERFPQHVVCEWLGNSEKVADEHYLHVWDEHFSRAAQNPAQQAAAHVGNERKSDKAGTLVSPNVPAYSDACNSMQDKGMTPTGFEPVSRP